MFSFNAAGPSAKVDHGSRRHAPAGGRVAATAVLTALALTTATIAASAQFGASWSSARKATKVAYLTRQERPVNVHARPLMSDAPYTCTLSGFGHLARCYPR